MNFAISNQFYVIAETFGLISTAFRRGHPRSRGWKGLRRPVLQAGPVAEGYVAALGVFRQSYAFFLGHAAMMVNEGLPNFSSTVASTAELRDRSIAVLGMAFKSESDDKRESLSYKLRKLLLVEAKEVLCTDPYVVDRKLVPLEEAMRRADVIILGAPHAAYRDLPLPDNKVMVDVWGFWPNRHPTVSGGNLAS